MSDAGISLEQRPTLEQPRPEIAPEDPPQEPVIPQHRQLNLENFYKDEVARYKVKQTLPGQKAWEELKRTAASKESSGSREEVRQVRPRSMMDKLHRQAVLVQARLEGVRNLTRFQELADYFESTVNESESKHVKVPKGLTDEQKKKVLEEWKAKGWNGDAYSIYEHQGDKEASLSLYRSVPLRLGREHVKLMKGLISADNNPVELAEGLKKMGFWFSEYNLKSADEMRKLGEFFTAPHAKETLDLARGISNWGSNWFANEGSSFRTKADVGQIEFLTQIAQSPDPKAAFSPELIQKIDTLSRALNMRVDVAEIGNLQSIMNNPYYLDFAAYLSQQGLSRGYGDYLPVFENIVALDKAGVLKPVVDLYRSGVAIEDSNRYYSSDSGPSIVKMFDSYKVKYHSQDVREETVQYLQGLLSTKEVQDFLQDPQKQEFVGVLSDIRGVPVSFSQLGKLENLFGEGLSRGKEAIYVLKALQGIQAKGAYAPDLDTLSAITSNPQLAETFTNPDFPVFLKTLEERAGYKPDRYNVYFEGRSKLADVFNNSEAREGLIRESTGEIIKAIGSIDLYHPEYYIRLGNNPNMLQTINSLKQAGFHFSDSERSLPDAEVLEDIANDPETLSKLKSPELKALSARLVEEFRWEFRSYEINNLIGLFDDKELQAQLFSLENLDFIKKIRPFGISLTEVKPMLELDPASRDLLVQMVDKFDYWPQFSSYDRRAQDEMLGKLLENNELRTKLFSTQTQDVFQRLRKDFGYYRLNAQDVETIVNAPPDFPDLVRDLKEKYKYVFQSRDLMPLLHLSANREGFNNLLDTLVVHGYQFKTEDIASISQLMPHAERLPALLDTFNQILSTEKPFEDSTVKRQYIFNINDIPYLLQLEKVKDRLPAAVAVLSEVMGYRFLVRDSRELAFVIESGYTKEKLADLKQIYDKYKGPYLRDFNIGAIQDAAFIEGNEGTITRLETYNYKFDIQQTDNLKRLLEFPDKEAIFQALDILKDNLPISYNPKLSQYYLKLAQISGLEEKLRKAGSTLMTKEDLMQENNFKLFVTLQADAALYNHARKLLSDDYFRNIRDAQNRFGQFNRSILSGEIADNVLAKIFAISGKATELDRIALKYGINAEIAKAAKNENWQTPLLQSANFQEANEVLTRMMTDLAIPVIYTGMGKEELSAKQNELIELARKDKEFDNILEINCRAVGVYGQKYPNKGQEFDVLMGAIRQSLELNLERNPKAYLEKRAELSKHQFERIFEGLPDDARKKVMKTWLDLSPRRRLRVSGEVVTAEEATLNRLNRIRDIVHTDLSVHLQELFITKVRELEAGVQRGEINGPGAEQIAIYKQYLMTADGVIRQDIPMMYRSIETFIRNAQAALKNPETPKEEKEKLGRSLGTYQGISGILKAVYRLGTISEERYKARRDYLNEIEKHIGEFSGALKRLKLLDPDKRSADVNTRALEEEVLNDFGKLKGTMAEENVSGQTIFETESTVDFRNLARAPEITQSCQRLTELTGYNQAAYSRLLDGSNEMIDIYEMRNGERNRLARSFIELSKVKLTGEKRSRLAVLIDREYVNPQYQNFGYQFSSEMMLHMLDRISTTPELSLIFDSGRFTAGPEVIEKLQERGYRLRQVTGEYFINESNVKLSKYYDSLNGITNVSQSSFHAFSGFYIIEKIT